MPICHFLLLPPFLVEIGSQKEEFAPGNLLLGANGGLNSLSKVLTDGCILSQTVLIR